MKGVLVKQLDDGRKSYDINEVQEMMRKDKVNPDNWLEFCAWLGKNGFELTFEDGLQD
jgi:hypothetical protein